MKRSPFAFLAAFFALALITVVLGLWQVDWKVEAVPLWFWGIPVLAGIFGVLSGRLMKRATPQRPLRERTLLIGAGWGLPTATMVLGTSLVNEPVTPVRLTLQVLLWALMSLGYGRIMAGLRRPV
ncbi:hypothetical protein QOL99_08925 [Deinococcus sp. MIMF12]|uniref:Uncharacterized protein n=1 Tax=Deinococcus rhizophilus TaxID=3049544 RepID=A0ABT7JGV4_9DEIO|nr:hypothetical protein [Deinococcus rhizophilus]MDL2344275.1 hypothetical protein [Deinococcus rhizophilus]